LSSVARHRLLRATGVDGGDLGLLFRCQVGRVFWLRLRPLRTGTFQRGGDQRGFVDLSGCRW